MNFCIMLLYDTEMRCNEMILMEPEDIKLDYILVKQ
jgi:integrase/recombinase XerD